ncbi:MAG TPA: aspartyl protease family protein [Candidatus Binatia bacterium]|jgi:hypothetical protein
MPSSRTLRLTFIASALAACLNVTASHAGQESSAAKTELRLFVSPDENSAIVATIDRQSVYAPVADIVGADGAKWYLIKSDGGATGWLKESNSEAAKQLESYFKPVPVIISSPTSRETSSRSGPSPGTRTSIPIEMSGATIIVGVTFNNSVTANLALDTGAAVTVVSKRIARNLGLSAKGSALMAGIGGTVLTQMARVESVKVGDAAVTNLTVSIHDFSRSPRYEGLLGLDFLNQFEMSLDARNRQLFLTPR